MGGVILSDGRKLTADIVVAADGVGSKSWSLVTGAKEKPISSGYALYRTSYPAEKALESPDLAEFFKDKREWTSLHIGPGAHFFIGLSPTEFSWGLTHRDEDSAVEDWNRVVDSRGALRYVQDWAPIVHEVIKSTPNNEATDWKLRFREPQPKWVSDEGRVVQCGDSAHSFLPSSGFGATTALEDAFSLAACLKMGGKESANIATKVHNHLRSHISNHNRRVIEVYVSLVADADLKEGDDEEYDEGNEDINDLRIQSLWPMCDTRLGTFVSTPAQILTRWDELCSIYDMDGTGGGVPSDEGKAHLEDYFLAMEKGLKRSCREEVRETIKFPEEFRLLAKQVGALTGPGMTEHKSQYQAWFWTGPYIQVTRD
ncbi:hypothetical protein COL922a_004482 [Colletotrichum nupharicola]|nr:hypothetical protein COL922a_004482 [Colletotrichum nupharicola]